MLGASETQEGDHVPYFTVVLLGAPGCGKHSLLDAYAKATRTGTDSDIDVNEAPHRLQKVMRERMLGNSPVIICIEIVTVTKETDANAINNAHGIICAFDLANDPKFAGHRDIFEALKTVRRRLPATSKGNFLYALMGTKADLCVANSAGPALERACPQVKKANRYLTSAVEDNGDSVRAAIDRFLVAIYHKRLLKLNETRFKRLVPENITVTAPPPRTAGSTSTASYGTADHRTARRTLSSSVVADPEPKTKISATDVTRPVSIKLQALGDDGKATPSTEDCATRDYSLEEDTPVCQACVLS